MSKEFAKIPSVDELLKKLKKHQSKIDRAYLKKLVEQTLGDIRLKPLRWHLQERDRGKITDAIISDIEQNLNNLFQPSLRQVVNATGVILHTGLGRAPLGKSNLHSLEPLSTYCNLEIDLKSGRRGDRLEHVVTLLQLLTGAEDAVVVNNNAAAVLLMLNSLAARKEVIVSRGELVEIGGSFRLPEVMRISNAKLVEVGATNKTHLRDYEQAVNDKTGAIMLVHPSNFEIVGFTEKPEIKDIIELGRSRQVPVIYDLGSGALVNMQRFGYPYEPVVADMLRAGFDLVSFSGDKLLGGP